MNVPYDVLFQNYINGPHDAFYQNWSECLAQLNNMATRAKIEIF